MSVRKSEWDQVDDDSHDLSLSYDRRDATSVARARESLRVHLGLDYLPVVCSEPRPGPLRRLWRRLTRRRPKAVAPSSTRAA